jgi:hypothetical protein
MMDRLYNAKTDKSRVCEIERVRAWDRRDPIVQVRLSMGLASDLLLSCCHGGRPWAPSRGHLCRRRGDKGALPRARAQTLGTVVPRAHLALVTGPFTADGVNCGPHTCAEIQ